MALSTNCIQLFLFLLQTMKSSMFINMVDCVFFIQINYRTVMTLTHGVNGLFPCPVCLVPKNEQSNLTVRHPLCTADDSQKICEDAKAQKMEVAKEKILKTRGICLIEV